MKELRRNMRIVGALLLCGMLVLMVYLNYAVMINGSRWTNSTSNTRLNTARKNVIAGDILDRNGIVLATTDEGKVDVFEYLQHPNQLARYELLSNCIACGVCEGSCPVFAGGEAFIGPAALITASRFINDSRDTQAAERMDAIDTADGIAACQSVRACTRECPRGIDVGEEIWQLIAQVKER